MINEEKQHNLGYQHLFPKHQANFFSNLKHFQILGTKNNFCLMRSITNNIILCVQLSNVDGSMKLIKKCLITQSFVQFLNTSNKLLVWNNNAIQLWRLDNMSHETLILEEEENFCYGWLNNKNNELVSIHYNQLNFWTKNDEGIWKISEKISFQLPITVEFNELGNFLLINRDFKSYLFNKRQIDGKWKEAYEFKKNSVDMLCFIDDEKLAHIEGRGLITIWHINTETLRPTKFQTLELYGYHSSQCFYQQCHIRYIKSQEKLFAFSQSKCYYFNQNNHQFIINRIIDFSYNPYIETIYCFDQNYLLIQHIEHYISKIPLKLMFFKLTN